MITQEVNAIALATAAEFVVGPEVAAQIGTLYQLLDKVMFAGFELGRTVESGRTSVTASTWRSTKAGNTVRPRAALKLWLTSKLSLPANGTKGTSLASVTHGLARVLLTRTSRKSSGTWRRLRSMVSSTRPRATAQSTRL
jgi:hypothetical protein